MTYTPDTTGSGKFGYEFNQDLNVIQYSKRKWLLGRERDYIDIYSNTPYSTINSVHKLTIPARQKAFDIKASARALYLPSSGSAAFGGQLRVRYKNVTVTGSDMYFPRSGVFIPVLGLEYQFLKL